ncbi:response regulator [Caulobacter sp. Root1455]|uniref:response regulator n=1 Tax=Caulobacter sp. Root1455 TaxID=1736465 RepID=UPI0009E8E87B|nr:response regulator transcription factor [Caulobacter sp. Root1455]
MQRRFAVVVDDHDLVRDGLRRVLLDRCHFENVLEAADLEGALDLLAQLPIVDLIAIDLHMPGASGPEALPALVEAFPDARIVVISGSESRDDIVGCLAAGVDGYIPKSLSVVEIVAAIESILSGQMFVPRNILRRGAVVVDPPSRARREIVGMEHLTPRQREVLGELLLAKTSKEIARALNVVEGTVKIHLAAIYRALGVRSRSEAIAKLASRS